MDLSKDAIGLKNNLGNPSTAHAHKYHNSAIRCGLYFKKTLSNGKFIYHSRWALEIQKKFSEIKLQAKPTIQRPTLFSSLQHETFARDLLLSPSYII